MDTCTYKVFYCREAYRPFAVMPENCEQFSSKNTIHIIGCTVFNFNLLVYKMSFSRSIREQTLPYPQELWNVMMQHKYGMHGR